MLQATQHTGRTTTVPFNVSLNSTPTSRWLPDAALGGSYTKKARLRLSCPPPPPWFTVPI